MGPELADTEESWPVDNTVDLHRDDWVMALRADRVRRPGDHGEAPFQRLVLEHPGAAVILAVDDQERVFCLWQYRHPAQRRLVELPAGLCDVVGEDPLEVARRELVEEAGLEAETWTYLTTAYSSPGISAEQIHYFVARDLRAVDRGDFVAGHEEADMQTGWVPAADLLAAALDGRVQDGPLLIALLLARTRGLVAA